MYENESKINYIQIFTTAGFIEAACFYFALKYQIWPLIIFNCLTVIWHPIGGYLIKKPKYVTMALVTEFAQIVIGVAMANVILGWAYGFSLYALMLIPVCFYNTFIDENIQHGLLQSMIFVVSDLLFVMASVIASTQSQNNYGVPVTRVKLIFCLNVAFCTIAIATYSFNYFRVMTANRDAIEKMAVTDPLTGLRNRNGIKPEFQKLLSSGSEYAIAIADIDNFKKLNDTYGHLFGDEVLKAVAGCFAQYESGTAVRWGGEEFLLMMSLSPKDAKKRADSIRHAVEELSLVSDGTKVKVTISVGLAFSCETPRIEALVKQADDRLYVAKASGKNQVVFES